MEWKTKPERQRWSRQLIALRESDEESFNALALELQAWQQKHNRAYRAFLKRSGRLTEEIKSWKKIPAVSQTLFKYQRLASHSGPLTQHTFLSSGTTGTQRSQHHLQDLLVYRAVSTALVPIFSSSDKLPLYFLTPSAQAAPHSSLASMFSFWKKSFGTKESQFWVQDDVLRIENLRQALEESCHRKQPLGILGPAFSFVPLLEAWRRTILPLPPGSFLMETGGFKGRTREIRKPAFYRQLARVFQISEESIWNEYGMSELSSQAYARGIKGEHRTPPWARVLVIDPGTDQEAKIGQLGLVRWIDLANIDSVLALQTQDLARRTREGFRLIGRLPQLPLRGCSLSVENLQRR